eukprot:Lankesteria_metandrocarpae@DN3720_c0_g1_i1.p1
MQIVLLCLLASGAAAPLNEHPLSSTASLYSTQRRNFGSGRGDANLDNSIAARISRYRNSIVGSSDIPSSDHRIRRAKTTVGRRTLRDGATTHNRTNPLSGPELSKSGTTSNSSNSSVKLLNGSILRNASVRGNGNVDDSASATRTPHSNAIASSSSS